MTVRLRRGRAGAVMGTSQVRDPGSALVSDDLVPADPRMHGGTPDVSPVGLPDWDIGGVVSGGHTLPQRGGLFSGNMNEDFGEGQPPDWFDPTLGTNFFGDTFGDARSVVGDSGVFDAVARMNAQQQDDADMLAENALYDIDLKEQALNQAMLDGDVAEAQRLIGEIAAAREYMKRAYQDYRNTVNPVYNDAIQKNSQIQDRNTGALSEIALAEQGFIKDAFGGATADIGAEAEKIGADLQAASAAQGIANELTGLYLETSEGRQDDAQRILQKLEDAAYEGARAFKAEDLWNIENRERIDLAGRDKDARDAQKALDDLDFRQQKLALDKAKMKVAHDETLRRLQEGKTTYIDSVGFGQIGAQTFLNNAYFQAGTPLDRQVRLDAVLTEAMESFGVTSPEAMREYLMTADEDGNIRANYLFNPGGLTTPGSNMHPEEIQMLINAVGAYQGSRSQYDALARVNDAGTVSYGSTTEAIQGWKSTNSNGKIPATSMVRVPPRYGAAVTLAPFAASAWQEMVEAAEADGVNLTPGGSYRTYESQVAVAEEKGLYKEGGLAAEPGTSQHGWGLAIDMHNITAAQSSWLQANASKFGWKTISREPWHWQFYGGSTYNETH